MKKFLKVAAIFLLIGAVCCLLGAVLYQEKPAECKALKDTDSAAIDDYTVVYCADLEVLERYAFQTMKEYRDSEGSYTDVTYYVYDASQSMDKNELVGEYYLVKFRDSTGKEYITSLSVPAEENMSKTLAKTPVKLSACLGAAPIRTGGLLNDNEEKLRQLRETALDACSEKLQLPRANITLSYRAETVEQYQKEFQKDGVTARIVMAVFAVVLCGSGVWLLRRADKKKV